MVGHVSGRGTARAEDAKGHLSRVIHITKHTSIRRSNPSFKQKTGRGGVYSRGAPEGKRTKVWKIFMQGGWVVLAIEHDSLVLLDDRREVVLRLSNVETVQYKGTSLIRYRTPLVPYRKPMPRVLGGS